MMKMKRTFVKNEDGVAAIEFSFFAIPFFLILMGTIEVALMMAADNILQGATSNAARDIKVGTISGSSLTELAAFRNAVCKDISAIIKCDPLSQNIKLDVLKVSGGSSLNTYQSSGAIWTSNGFDTGYGTDYVLIRVTFDYPLLTPIATPILEDSPGSHKRTLIATAVLENEPY